MLKILRPIVFIILFLTGSAGVSTAQPYIYPFTSGPIPMCDTSYFTANVSGVGLLYPPGNSWWFFTLQSLMINITSNHPQTLQISLTSPQGTTLLLSEFNGAGGSNYTNCNFWYNGAPSITTGTAPFTGNWMAQGGSFSAFDYELGDGTWIITVIDTACAGGSGPGPGGPWTAGWFDGAGGGAGGFTINFSSPPPPPCWNYIPDNSADICQGESVDILGYYMNYDPSMSYTVYDGSWGNIAANPSAVTTSGWYFIEGFEIWTGCYYSASFLVNVYPQIVLGPDQTVSSCPGAPVDLTALFPLTGIQSIWSLNGAPLTGAAASAATQAGVYQVIGQNPALCNDTALVTFNLTSGPALGADQSVNSCAGSNTDLTTLYSTTGLTTAWYFGGAPFGSPSTASNAGVYTLIATDAGGCSDTAEVTLMVTPSVLLGADQNISGCITGSYDLTPLYNTAGLSANWYFNGNPVANPAGVVSNGTYTLVVSSGVGCADTALVMLSVSQNPNLGADQSLSTCSGVPADLTALYSTGANTSAWYFGGTTISNPSSAITAGVYTLIITTPGGCTDTADVTLSVQPAPALGSDQSVTGCITGGYDLTSAYTTTGLAVSWYLNNVLVINPASVTVNGTYMLLAQNAGGCMDTAQLVLNVSQNPALGADQSVSSCSGVPVDLTALYSTGANTSAWYLGGTAIPNPSSAITAGVYTLVITTPGGCTDTADVTLSVQPAPVLGADQLQGICSNTTLDLTGLYATTGLVTSWTLSGIPVANPSNVNTAGVYMLVATNASSCTDTADFTLTVQQSPALGSDQVSSICAGTTADLTSLYTTTGLTTSWTNSGIAVADPSAVVTAGAYTLIATNASGCTDTAFVNVNVLAIPIPGADQTVTQCDGTFINLNSLFNTTGSTVSWTSGGNPVSNPANTTASGVYTVTVTNSSGCTAMANATIVFNPTPVLGSDQAVALCGGTTADLTSLYNLTALVANWSQGGIALPDPTTVSTAGNYQLVVSNSFGCTDTSQVSVSVNSGPSLGSDQSFALCPWQTIDLSAIFPVTGLTAMYELNGAPVANYTAVYDSGLYVVTVTDANGCTDVASAAISNVVCLCVADFAYAGRCIQDPVQFELIADSALISAHWNFGGAAGDQFVSDPEVKFSTDEKVIVTLEATLSCGVVIVKKEMEMTDCADSCHFYLPSAFTPNGDGKNDTFKWYGECGPEEFSMEIYNRFGQLLYTSANPFASWDGRYENKDIPTGVYVYHIAYRFPYQKKQLLTGTMSVMR